MPYPPTEKLRGSQGVNNDRVYSVSRSDFFNQFYKSRQRAAKEYSTSCAREYDRKERSDWLELRADKAVIVVIFWV